MNNGETELNGVSIVILCLGRALQFNKKILAVDNWSKWSACAALGHFSLSLSSNLVPFLPGGVLIGFVNFAWVPMSKDIRFPPKS